MLSASDFLDEFAHRLYLRVAMFCDLCTENGSSPTTVTFLASL